MVSEVEAVETLVCEASQSGYALTRTLCEQLPSDTLKESAAEWPASGLENRGAADNRRSSILPLSTKLALIEGWR